MVPRSHKVPLMVAEAVDKGERKEEESAKLREFLQTFVKGFCEDCLQFTGGFHYETRFLLTAGALKKITINHKFTVPGK